MTTRADRERAAQRFYGATWDNDPQVMRWIETGEHDPNYAGMVTAGLGALISVDSREAAVKAERERTRAGIDAMWIEERISKVTRYDLLQIVDDVRPVAPDIRGQVKP